MFIPPPEPHIAPCSGAPLSGEHSETESGKLPDRNEGAEASVMRSRSCSGSAAVAGSAVPGRRRSWMTRVLLPAWPAPAEHGHRRSEEHTSELQSLMRISYA